MSPSVKPQTKQSNKVLPSDNNALGRTHNCSVIVLVVRPCPLHAHYLIYRFDPLPCGNSSVYYSLTRLLPTMMMMMAAMVSFTWLACLLTFHYHKVYVHTLMWRQVTDECERCWLSLMQLIFWRDLWWTMFIQSCYKQEIDFSHWVWNPLFSSLSSK